MRVISHEHPKYQEKRKKMKGDMFNGAYYYSREIVELIIPRVETDRPWVTINIPGECEDHAIVFIHNNLKPDLYDWMKEYKDLILVCGVPETCDKVAHLGTPIYLPLSVDVEEVKKYRCMKTKKRALVGRANKVASTYVLPKTDRLVDMPRSELLRSMALYKEIYAVGRCAIEGMILGCRILPYDARYPDVNRWKVLDSRDAAKMLNEELKKWQIETT